MSNRAKQRPINGKIVIKGKIKCKTGLFIGGLEESLEIGGIDGFIIRDPVTMEPYIPGSSLKGKMRYLMERKENKKFNNKSHNTGIYRHECKKMDCSVCRLYGAGEDGPASRIMVRDAYLTKSSKDNLEKLDTDMPYVEIKKENTIDRVTASAAPRTTERVPMGAVFSFEIVYTVENENRERNEDVFNILTILSLIEDDALGGNISRGYGQIEFNSINIEARPVEYYTKDEVKINSISFNSIKEFKELKKDLNGIISF